MSSISLKPLLPKQAVSPQEFWPAYPNFSNKIAPLFGGMNKMEKIPIFPFEDLQLTNYCEFALRIQKLDVPIAFFFDATGGNNGIYLAYRIKLLGIPRFKCCHASVKKRDIEMIYFSLADRNSLMSLNVSRVVTNFGPASIMWSNSIPLYHDNPFMSLIEKIFKGEFYQYKIKPDCLSWYTHARVELDND